jgi:hypothetical protein
MEFVNFGARHRIGFGTLYRTALPRREKLKETRRTQAKEREGNGMETTIFSSPPVGNQKDEWGKG